MARLISWFNVPDWDMVALSAITALAALLAGLLLHWLAWKIFLRIAGRKEAGRGAILVAHLRPPSRIFIPLLILMVVEPSLAFPAGIRELLQHLLSILFIAVTSWLFIGGTLAARDIVLLGYDFQAKDNLKARAVYTQLTVLVKIVEVIIVVFAVATILMTFQKIRQVGMSILASAGIAGIIVGFAAQRSIATLLAGLQVALTQPIRIDDVVIVEEEWGVVEEITLTYVVIRIWDLRRLVVPVTYFLEKPFQNWTRASANLLGTVYLYADYTVPVDELRRALHGILDASAKWDRQVWGLQITKVNEQTMELRALMSAADASTAWDLRCEVREKLVAFLRENYPDALPRVRAEIQRRMPQDAAREMS